MLGKGIGGLQSSVVTVRGGPVTELGALHSSAAGVNDALQSSAAGVSGGLQSSVVGVSGALHSSVVGVSGALQSSVVGVSGALHNSVASVKGALHSSVVLMLCSLSSCSLAFIFPDPSPLLCNSITGTALGGELGAAPSFTPLSSTVLSGSAASCCAGGDATSWVPSMSVPNLSIIFRDRGTHNAYSTALPSYRYITVCLSFGKVSGAILWPIHGCSGWILGE